MADIYDPSGGVAPPSSDLTHDGESAPGPKAFPIKKIGQIKMSGWTIYAEGEKLYAKSPSGVKTQFVLFDPAGLTEDAKPNKVSDGSDGSTNSKGLTPTTSTGSTTQTSTNSTGGASTAVADVGLPDVVIAAATVTGIEPEVAVASVSDVLPEATIEAVATTAAVSPGEYEFLYDTTPRKSIKPSTLPLQASVGIKPAGNYTGTYFLNQDEKGKPAADAFLGRPLEPDEWDDLLSVTYAEQPSGSASDWAWIMGTILNRARRAGITVGQVILDATQFSSAGSNPSNKFREGPGDAADSSLSAAALSLSGVLRNNYYFSKTTSPVMYKGGVLGIPIGKITVFPGAIWR